MASLDGNLRPTEQSHNRKVDERLDILGTRIDELAKLLNMKTERLGVKQKMIDDRHEEITQDFQKRLTSLLSKFSDISRVELKIQEVIEHHNQVVRSFENRMIALKRTTENQEFQLFKAIGELEEARREIARLRNISRV